MSTTLRRALKKLRWRNTLAYLTFVAFIAAIGWALSTSFTERRVDQAGFVLNAPRKYYILVDSVDALNQKARVQSRMSVNNAFIQLSAIAHSGSFDTGIQILYGKLILEDLSETYEAYGLSAVPESPLWTKLSGDQNLNTQAPALVTETFSLLGNPRLFPFDRYLLIGSIDSKLAAMIGDKPPMPIPEGKYTIQLNDPAFVLRGVSAKDLETWPIPRHSTKSPTNDRETYDPKVWETGHFAVILERPLFVRLSTWFLGLVAIASLVFIAMHTKPSRFLLNAAAYFIALWTMKTALSAGAPATNTLLDYGVVGLYGTLCAAMLARVIASSQTTRATRKQSNKE